MRKLIAALSLLPLLAFANPGGTVFQYECAKVNPKVTNFTCQFDGVMKLHLIKPDKQMSQAQVKRYKYEFERIALRYMQLGGHEFDVTADFWPKNGMRICIANEDGASYHCDDCIEKNGECNGIK